MSFNGLRSLRGDLAQETRQRSNLNSSSGTILFVRWRVGVSIVFSSLGGWRAPTGNREFLLVDGARRQEIGNSFRRMTRADRKSGFPFGGWRAPTGNPDFLLVDDARRREIGNSFRRMRFTDG